MCRILRIVILQTLGLAIRQKCASTAAVTCWWVRRQLLLILILEWFFKLMVFLSLHLMAVVLVILTEALAMVKLFVFPKTAPLWGVLGRKVIIFTSRVQRLEVMD